MKIKIKHFVVLLFLVLSQQVIAKSIEGYIYDKQERTSALIGVNVYWAGTTEGTTSNNEGYFKLTKVDQNNQLVISYVGYESDTIVVVNNKLLTIYLNEGANLDEVNVVERVNSASISKLNPILTTNITSKELTKFACCNLSESFETNASVDVSYADAVSGIKQIKMLGLSGRYSQLMLENIPIIRGSETAFGLDYIPGTWMNSIQVSKGTSAVKNGYESITGQININFIDPNGNEKVHFYMYGNQDGKIESNAGVSLNVNENWATNVLVHAGVNVRELDMNDDGFLDKPTGYSTNLMNRWNYKGKKVEAKLGISVLNEERKGGQVTYDHELSQADQSAYGIAIDVTRFNAFSKVGFLFSRPNTSIGWISSANYFKRESFYGLNTLNVNQLNLYTNLIFQSYLVNTKHTYNTGLSLVYDQNDEIFNNANVGNNEIVPGIFFEYNFIPSEQLSVLLGVRNDYSSLHGNFITPRAHAKYSFPAYTTLRVSAGKGYRTPTIISENTQYLATSKAMLIDDNIIQEEAWNYGISLANEFPLGKRDLLVTAEFFRTDFQNQLVVDLQQNAQEVHFYNLSGKSYANSLQLEVFYELFKGFELNGGFRYNDVKTEYQQNLSDVPFISKYKGLISAQYRTNLDKWQFDATLQFHGPQQLLQSADPSNASANPQSDSYVNLIAQVTKNYRYWSFYVGAENLTDFTQGNAIIGVNNPFGDTFDASQVWGPLYGRMFYVGIKYNLDKRF